MLPWEKSIPEYLTNRKNTVNFILFTALFALVFINIYAPFGSNKWLDLSDVRFFAYSSIVILIGMLVIVLSRIILVVISRKHAINFVAYALWIMGEIIVLALVYALIQWYFIHVGNDLLSVFNNTIRTTAYIILLPYFISWLYLAFKDKYNRLQRLEKNSADQTFSPEEGKPPLSASMIPFRDERGILKFSIKKEDLLYLEAADNYIIIHYLDNLKPAKYIIRNTLKRVEEGMPSSGLVRCHRSFMVNMDNVKVIRKEKDGLIIGFESPAQLHVPISKTYLEPFIRQLSHYSITEES
jgi:DNA-binding LytR/AlgR family response regulator